MPLPAACPFPPPCPSSVSRFRSASRFTRCRRPGTASTCTGGTIRRSAIRRNTRCSFCSFPPSCRARSGGTTRLRISSPSRMNSTKKGSSPASSSCCGATSKRSSWRTGRRSSWTRSMAICRTTPGSSWRSRPFSILSSFTRIFPATWISPQGRRNFSASGSRGTSSALISRSRSRTSGAGGTSR